METAARIAKQIGTRNAHVEAQIDTLIGWHGAQLVTKLAIDSVVIQRDGGYVHGRGNALE